MLSYLRIAAFATIEEFSVSFDDGLTVITGETGAGKSLLVDALAFVSGQKPRSLSVRPGCEEGFVEALFTPMGSLPDLFSDLVSPEEEIVVRRIFATNGRVRQTVNGQTVPLSQLQSLVSYLYDIVGQEKMSGSPRPTPIGNIWTSMPVPSKCRSLSSPYDGKSPKRKNNGSP